MLRGLRALTKIAGDAGRRRRSADGRFRAAGTPTLTLEALEPRHLLNGEGLVINEFMASNDLVLEDAEFDDSDWIEIHNPTAAAVSLDGCYLTNDDTLADKWTFPDTAPDSTVELACNEERFQLAA